MTKRKVVFRADGNSEIGLGHVIRSLALAEMLKDHFDCVFAIQQPSHALKQQIEAIGISLILLPLIQSQNNEYIFELHPFLNGYEIIVLDGYKFTTDYQLHLKRKGCFLVCIDDIHTYSFVANVIINHAGGISKSEYEAEMFTQYYLGTLYALLRTPFLIKEKSNKCSNCLGKVFINMGGADPKNDLQNVLSLVSSKSEFKEINVVTGDAYKFETELKSSIESDKRIRHYRGLNAEKMAELMRQCGVAICPPSSVAYEYASIGGVLFLKQIAANQIDVKSFFLKQRIALDFDKEFLNATSENLTAISKRLCENQKRVLDGRSDERLKDAFRKMDLALATSLRKARKEDLMTCFYWANDPDVRKQSFQQEPITLEDHAIWFEKKIVDNKTHFYIAENNLTPIGLIRFDGDENERIISYLIAPAMRGKGLGAILLSKGIEQLIHDAAEPYKISGYVKKSNVASCRSFERLGFISFSEAVGSNNDSVKYEIVKNKTKPEYCKNMNNN